MNQSNHTYDDNINSWIYKEIISYKCVNPKILDVGCWKGQLWKKILMNRKEHIYWVKGFSSPEFSNASWYKCVYTLDLNDLNSFEIIEGNLNIIVCWDVLKHTIYPKEVLKKLHSKLSFNRIMLVSILCICFMINRFTHIFGNWNYTPVWVLGIMDITHYKFFSLQIKKEFCIRSGLEIEIYEWLNTVRNRFFFLRVLWRLFPSLFAIQMFLN
jgi:hypothetical protein